MLVIMRIRSDDYHQDDENNDENDDGHDDESDDGGVLLHHVPHHVHHRSSFSYNCAVSPLEMQRMRCVDGHDNCW